MNLYESEIRVFVCFLFRMCQIPHGLCVKYDSKTSLSFVLQNLLLEPLSFVSKENEDMEALIKKQTNEISKTEVRGNTILYI